MWERKHNLIFSSAVLVTLIFFSRYNFDGDYGTAYAAEIVQKDSLSDASKEATFQQTLDLMYLLLSDESAPATSETVHIKTVQGYNELALSQ